MSKKFERRITDLVRMYVCDLIEREIKDPRIEGVTVTDVEVTSDTKYATVYYSVIGDEAKKEELAAGLRSSAGWVSRELGKRLRTKNSPHVKFVFDNSLERGDRMSQLLEELKQTEQERMANAPPLDTADGEDAAAGTDAEPPISSESATS
jgi:ribosome-binding factor A